MKQFEQSSKSHFGEELAKLRRVKNLTLEKVALLTKIPQRYLEFLEKGEFSKLPADVYIRGILAKYAQIIEADFEQLWQQLEEERSQIKSNNPNVLDKLAARQSGVFDRLPSNRFSIPSLTLSPKIISFLFLAAILFFIFGYFFYQINFLVGPPVLSVFEPAEDILTKNKNIKLVGRTEASAVLTINGRPTKIGTDGYFEEELVLQPGINVIEFLAKNHLGKSSLIKRIVILETEDSLATTTSQ